MDINHIHDLEVFYRVGVPDDERAQPQRLLLDVQLHLDFHPAATTDDLTKTINYFAVTQQLLKFGEGREWKLIEKLAEDIASTLLTTYRPTRIRIGVKKFIIPQTKYISVAIERPS